MNISALIGKKINQTQGFLEDGTRVPLSVISVGGNVVSQIKTKEQESYNSIQLGFGNNKKPSKPMSGHIKKAGLENAPRFFSEVRADALPELSLGQGVTVQEVFEPGDIIDVSGTSKGKGYAGVVKRHGFAGGPRTHGQSDRERAPGSIGQTTTPGRVYKGKKMAGRMGNDQVTVKNLEILSIDGDTVLVKGLVPGAKGSIVMLKKVGKNKKFIPLFSKKEEEAPEETVQTVEENVQTADENIQTVAETVETVEEVKTEEDVKTGETIENQETAPAEELGEEKADSAPDESSVEPKEEK